MLKNPLAYKRKNHYAKVDLMLQDLEAYLDGRPVAARDDTGFLPPGHWHLALTARAARLRKTHIGLLCLGSLLGGLCIGLQAAFLVWLPEYTAALVAGFAFFALVPAIYTLTRGSRPGDPDLKLNLSPTRSRGS